MRVAGAGVAGLALPATTKRVWAAEPIRIAGLLPLSGPADSLGRNLRIGMEIAKDQLNAEGGVLGRPIELVFRDDKANPANSVGAARELASEGVNFIVGLPVTSTAAAVMPILEQLKSMALVTGSTAPSLTHELFVRNVFRVSDSGYAQANGLARLMAERHPTIRRWAGVFPDASSGHQSWNNFVALLKKRHPAQGELKFLDPVLTKPGATDFKTQVFRLMSENPDGLVNVVYGSEGVTLFDQMKTLGLSDKLKVVIDLALEMDLARSLKSRVPANTWSYTHAYFGAHLDEPLAASVLAEAVKRSGEEVPSNFIGISNSAVRALAAGITAAKATATDEVVAALENITFRTVKGPMRFRKEDHAQMSTIDLINVTPKDSAPGWQVKEFVKYPTDELIEPASPGTALEL